MPLRVNTEVNIRVCRLANIDTLQEAGDACHVRTQLNDLALHEFS